MLRGVITRINGRPAREVAGDHWVLQGDRGVTYSARPPEGTVVTAGAWWPEDYDGPPQISFAAEEGAEMGLSLGDRLTVNILGRDIEGEITSFREVDFSTAGIGFVLSMNPGALPGAPHTHHRHDLCRGGGEAAILRDLATAFPNITAIRVKDAIDRVTEVLGGDRGGGDLWGAGDAGDRVHRADRRGGGGRAGADLRGGGAEDAGRLAADDPAELRAALGGAGGGGGARGDPRAAGWRAGR
jgi:putative ABC transport system permease protein